MRIFTLLIIHGLGFITKMGEKYYKLKVLGKSVGGYNAKVLSYEVNW